MIDQQHKTEHTIAFEADGQMAKVILKEEDGSTLDSLLKLVFPEVGPSPLIRPENIKWIESR